MTVTLEQPMAELKKLHDHLKKERAFSEVEEGRLDGQVGLIEDIIERVEEGNKSALNRGDFRNE